MNQPDLGDSMETKYKNGPYLEQRSCTDIVCLGFFSGFTLLCLLISIFGLVFGNPDYLAQPFDPDHNPCGVGKLSDYPYIYFVSPAQHTLYRTVCVKECPSTKKSDNTGVLQCSPNSVVTSCKSNLSPSNAQERVLYYDSTPYVGRICLPTVSQYFEVVNDALNSNKPAQAFSDLRNTWMIICFSGLFSIGLGYLIFKMIERNAFIAVWGLAGTIVFGLSFLGCFFLGRYISVNSTKQVNLKDVYSGGNQVLNQVARQDTSPSEYLVIAIIFFILSFMTAAILYCMRNRINLSIIIIKVSATVLRDTQPILYVPIIFFIIIFMYYMWWVVIATNLYSCGTISDKPHSLPFGQFTFNQGMRNIAYIHIFSLIWNSAFLLGSCQFIILTTCSFWYFQRKNEQYEQQQNQTVINSVMLLLKYHIGTVAFGSVLVAVLDALRITFEFLDNQVQEHQDTENKILQVIIKSCQSILFLYEKFLKYINKNAYLMTIMTGDPFSKATKDVHQLIERRKYRARNNQNNDGSLLEAAGIGEVFDFLGNLAIMMFSTLVCFLAISTFEYYTSRLHSPLLPTICFIVLSYCVGSCIMSLLGTGADAVIILYFMDEDMNRFEEKERLIFYHEAQFEPEELKEFKIEQKNKSKK